MNFYDAMVKAYTATTGTGAITVGSAVSGFKDFSDVPNGASVTLAMEDDPNIPTQWEHFRGIWNSGTGVVSRGDLIASSTGSRVNFTGSVFILRLIASTEFFNGAEENSNSALVTGGTTATYTIQTRRNATPETGTTFEATVNHASPSGGCTMNYNGVGAVDLVDEFGDALAENDLVVGPRYKFRFDGTDWRVMPIISPSSITSKQDASSNLTAFAAKTAPSGAVVGTTDTQTLSGKTLGNTKETTYTITDGAAFSIDPANGGLQKVTLGASRSPVASSFVAGQSMGLKIAGTTYAITWPSVVWNGGSAPTLSTTGWTHIELWKDGDALYGALVGVTA